jgi:5-methylcytosine-specific restriction endonuclease McrA
MLRRLSGEQNHRCCYCGTVTRFAKVQNRMIPDAATVEHVVPVGRGGSDDWSNLAMACMSCNGKRKSFDPYWFFDQQFWKPENRRSYQIAQMQEAFRRNPTAGLLKAMAERCCQTGEDA